MRPCMEAVSITGAWLALSKEASAIRNGQPSGMLEMTFAFPDPPGSPARTGPFAQLQS